MTEMGAGNRGQGPANVPILPAATLVVVRPAPRPEILLVKRSGKQVFMPDIWVFPGGRVEETDTTAPNGDPFRAAALRETAEEAALALQPGPDALPEIACWVTPTGEKRRFHTRFFLTVTGACDHEACPDSEEVVAARWLAASDALELHRTGQLPLAPPTWWTLRQLALHPDVDAIMRWAQRVSTAPIPVIQPTLGLHAGRPAVFWDDGGLWLQLHETGPAWTPVESR